MVENTAAATADGETPSPCTSPLMSLAFLGAEGSWERLTASQASQGLTLWLGGVIRVPNHGQGFPIQM